MWTGLLKQLKKDSKTSIDAALKVPIFVKLTAHFNICKLYNIIIKIIFYINYYGIYSVLFFLQRALSDLNLPGGFPSTHLCVYRWAEFGATLDHTHPIGPLVWQRFFMLYLQRPLLDSS